MYNFWQAHSQGMGEWLIVGLLVFPRITMLYAVLTPFGFLYWLGWLFAPRYLAAWIATMMYWPTNKGLVLGAWIAAVLISSGEGTAARRVN